MNLSNDSLKERVVELDKTMSRRAIASVLSLPRSTVSDFLNKKTYKSWWGLEAAKKEEPWVPKTTSLMRSAVGIDNVQRVHKLPVYNIHTSNTQPDECTHLMIPDTQCKPGISLDYLTWVGEYIVNRKPSVIVHIGDHADMPSLSSYDKGKRTAEGKRLTEDLVAAVEGMNALLKPLHDLQKSELEEYGKVLYKPRMVLTLGNHEERIMRHVNAYPELHGMVDYSDLRYEEMGWEVYDFLEPVIINGVTYCHFMANPYTGKPYGGQASNILKHVGESFTMGHKQTLDVSTRFLPASGRQQWAIVAGACYVHAEDYKGHQGNHHWRGIVVKHNVNDGSYNPMFVSLKFLEEKYGNRSKSRRAL